MVSLCWLKKNRGLPCSILRQDILLHSAFVIYSLLPGIEMAPIFFWGTSCNAYIPERIPVSITGYPRHSFGLPQQFSGNTRRVSYNVSDSCRRT